MFELQTTLMVKSMLLKKARRVWIRETSFIQSHLQSFDTTYDVQLKREDSKKTHSKWEQGKATQDRKIRCKRTAKHYSQENINKRYKRIKVCFIQSESLFNHMVLTSPLQVARERRFTPYQIPQKPFILVYHTSLFTNMSCLLNLSSSISISNG